jgi:hypothetical protein
MKFLIFSFLSLVFTSNNVFSQNDEAAKKQMEKMEKEIKIKQEEYVNDFIASLEVDEFQKEIIKQKIHSYFEIRKTIFTTYTQEFKRNELVEQLDATHFLDIKEMVTEDTMTKIMESVKGTGAAKDKKKKKKKNKKND